MSHNKVHPHLGPEWEEKRRADTERMTDMRERAKKGDGVAKIIVAQDNIKTGTTAGVIAGGVIGTVVGGTVGGVVGMAAGAAIGKKIAEKSNEKL